MNSQNWPFETVEIACDHCGRFGRYHKATFLEVVGEQIELPQALEIVSQDCPHRANDLDPMRKVCRPYYAQD
ncbi:hypothetical protein BXY66_1205 [Shimia isoporae]|uniref:Uncharacterized protein n=1 Tax=Shimia isoporae TaxID=647720 RepID=A0A4V2Q400_9RHOB|nr:hypothetical protein [Shimia isoporae]TCL09160.1 hypothetical protein BXY66_1205 [Shimia isoporae]